MTNSSSKQGEPELKECPWCRAEPRRLGHYFEVFHKPECFLSEFSNALTRKLIHADKFAAWNTRLPVASTADYQFSDNWIYEDDLPKDITKALYDDWYKRSRVVDGVRMGPSVEPVASTAPRVDNVPHCWHCGIVLEATELRPRCDECSADCDDEFCNAFGCAPSTAAASPAPKEEEAISRADAIQILQDARERGVFDLRGLIAELKGLPAIHVDTKSCLCAITPTERCPIHAALAAAPAPLVSDCEGESD